MSDHASDILQRFADAVRAHYGPCLAGVYLFGSRARGDHSEESDADVAVVLHGPFDFWEERAWLGDLAYDYLLEHWLHIQPYPFRLTEWDRADTRKDLVSAARRDARPIPTAA